MSINMNDSAFQAILKAIRHGAQIDMMSLPQYKGHFDDYLLGQMKKKVIGKSKYDVKFSAKEYVMFKPVLQQVKGIDGKVRMTVVAWSNSYRCDVAVLLEDIDIPNIDYPVELIGFE